MAVSKPKQRLRPRATLYSPPPSQAWNIRVVATRVSPGSSRSMTSPSETRSKRDFDFGLIVRPMTSYHSRRTARPSGRSKEEEATHLEPVVLLVGPGPFAPVVRPVGLRGALKAQGATDGRREIDEHVDVIVVSDPEGSRRIATFCNRLGDVGRFASREVARQDDLAGGRQVELKPHHFGLPFDDPELGVHPGGAGQPILDEPWIDVGRVIPGERAAGSGGKRKHGAAGEAARIEVGDALSGHERTAEGQTKGSV